jgi:hypothetical protein
MSYSGRQGKKRQLSDPPQNQQKDRPWNEQPDPRGYEQGDLQGSRGSSVRVGITFLLLSSSNDLSSRHQSQMITPARAGTQQRTTILSTLNLQTRIFMGAQALVRQSALCCNSQLIWLTHLRLDTHNYNTLQQMDAQIHGDLQKLGT